MAYSIIIEINSKNKRTEKTMNVNVKVLIRVSVITVGLVRIIKAKPGGQERELRLRGEGNDL